MGKTIYITVYLIYSDTFEKCANVGVFLFRGDKL